MKPHTSLSLQSVRVASLLAGIMAVMVGGCAETLDTHGQVILPSAMAQIQPNISTKDDVVRLLGTPSAAGTLNSDRWYYVSSVVGKKAFEPHNLKTRKVVIVDFDPSTSLVLAVNERTEADGKAIEPSEATTQTQGQTLGFFEQIFGNVGLRN